ncbi:MAG: hypothetical protein EOL88_01895 [Bacteroidia bacterium]|nr:hypothetical protein [Bacteroidia bacterium]
MTKQSLSLNKPSRQLLRHILRHDNSKIWYDSKLLNLLQLYFFTGILANWGGLVFVNNVILLVCIISVFFFKKGRTISFLSPLTFAYGLLTLLSIVNHIRWLDDAGMPANARTMLFVFMAMIAFRQLAIPGFFERAINVNALPFALLIPLGHHGIGGRYYSYFLNENILGSALPFAYAVGLCSFAERRYEWKSMVALFASLAIMVLGARRSLLLYCIPSTLIVLVSIKKISLRDVCIVVILFLFFWGVVVPNMNSRLAERFGSNFSLVNHFNDIFYGVTDDKSASVRSEFIDISIKSANHDLLGYGNGNFRYIVEQFGGSNVPVAGHPHSGLAESMITGGYIGLVLYLFMLFYLIKIGYNDTVIRICMIWMFLGIFVETNLNNRIIWPLLAIAEKELTCTRKDSKEHVRK